VAVISGGGASCGKGPMFSSKEVCFWLCKV
jgi:hypothetical protein